METIICLPLLARMLICVCVLLVDGVFLYYLGGFLYYKTKYKRFGHYLVAVSGIRSSWLVCNCPYAPGTCRTWNCPNFHRCGGDNHVG